MDFVENVIGLIEDTITDSLYDMYPDKKVDRFLKNHEEEIVSHKMLDLIDELETLLCERLDNYVDQLDEKEESDDE
jgi:hypothetical protein